MGTARDEHGYAPLHVAIPVLQARIAATEDQLNRANALLRELSRQWEEYPWTHSYPGGLDPIMDTIDEYVEALDEQA